MPLPTSSPPLQLLSSDRRADRPEITLPTQKRLIPRSDDREPRRSAMGLEMFSPGAGHDRISYGCVRGYSRQADLDISESCDFRGCYSRPQKGQARDCNINRHLTVGLEHEQACADFDIDAVTTGTGDHFTRIGDSTAGTAGTLWRSSTAKNGTKKKDKHVMQLGMAMTAIPREQVSGGLNALLESTYQDSMKCQPLYFKGTEGVVELTQWFERMETVFHISNCSVDNQIKFSTCTLLAGALTWWDSYVRIVGQDVAYEMTWTNLRKKMTDKYCPRNEMKKLEVEL
ncbi:hypothetical protein Tco_0693439 [Tanacetum coccineum]